MKRTIKYAIATMAVSLTALAGWVAASSAATEREIAQHRTSIRQVAAGFPGRQVNHDALRTLPAPVQRYLTFALPNPVRPFRVITLTARGDFRRPGSEGFADTTAAQAIAVGTPALMFDATTPFIAGVRARAWDFFARGEMVMRARIASTLTVVDESATEALNRTSLRRWLLESPLYPMALLPGGPVRWEAIDERRARAVVSGFGLEAAMVATFRDDGSLASFDAEQDGDLTTPYHGSGERAVRDDYRMVQGVMVPHRFEVARVAGGQTLPFFKGEITSIAFE